MHDIGISAGSHEACAERVLKHVAGPSCILADDYFSLLIKPGAIVPAKKTPDLDRMLVIQSLVRFAAEAVCSEIFTHFFLQIEVVFNLFFIAQYPWFQPWATRERLASES